MSTAYSLDDENDTQLGTRYYNGGGLSLRMDMTQEEWDDIKNLKLPVFSELGERFETPLWWMRQMMQETDGRIEFQTADSIRKDIEYYNNHRFGPIFDRHKARLRQKLAQKLKTDSPKPNN